MSSTPMQQPGQIGAGNDMDMIPSYGGSSEKEQSSTTAGGGLGINTVPSNDINRNPDQDQHSHYTESSK